MAEPSPSKPFENPRYFATVPPQEILPVLDSNFETSVPGIYVIGDAGGLPLVKIAANQGRAVIEKMASKRNPDESSPNLDLVIVGGGPAGISAAIEAQKKGWKYVLIEQTRIASTVRNFPPEKKVYAEPRTLPNQSELDCEEDLTKSEFLDMVQRKAKSNGLQIKEQTEVSRIRQTEPHRFEVETTQGTVFKCAHVIIAIGRQGKPNLLDVPGAENNDKVTYQFRSPDDFQNKDILVVGGGNSAIETALQLAETNSVTLSYRGTELFRAKEENRKRIERAAEDGKIRILFDSEVSAIKDRTVELRVGSQSLSLPNDQVIIQIGTLPPVEFLMQTGIELDGIWTRKRFLWALTGILVGVLIYFFTKDFVLIESRAGSGKWYIPAIEFLSSPLQLVHQAIVYLLPIPWLLLLGLSLVNRNLKSKNHPPLFEVKGVRTLLVVGGLIYYANGIAPHVFTLDIQSAGPGPYYLPGFQWLFRVVPGYFAGLNGFYYLLYFTGILVFGLYWAIRTNHSLIWKRNLTIIGVQWTLWWGIPTFLVVFLGTNPWTPLLSRAINAWPLKMDAFDIDPSLVRPGAPEWWYIVGVVSVVWAVFLTVVIIPLFTIRFGKVYCSYVCSCGALAETVGNSFRHRGPKGSQPRRLEKFGFVVLGLSALATIASLYNWENPRDLYNIWVGTFLAGAVSIGLYPFLGQRLWCRLWCPLAFWMNFWGRWSRFKISVEKGKCIDCNMCNQYCQMGIDIKSRALQGKPVTLVDTPCVGCAECVVRCPMEILHLGDVPDNRSNQTADGEKLHQIGESK